MNYRLKAVKGIWHMKRIVITLVIIGFLSVSTGLIPAKSSLGPSKSVLGGNKELTETVVAPPNGSDDTSVIQAALDRKGHVVLQTPGTYITDKLLIDSDTWLDIRGGVTIKKIDGSISELLVNKGHITATRNKNIKITGGLWDLNYPNTTAPGNYGSDPQTNPGIGILMHRVDGFVMSDFEQVGYEHKYTILVSDGNNIRFDGILLDNRSDGIHFHPPMNNVIVENISGYTGDDTIAFTMGDYDAYNLSDIGDIENVVVNNVNTNSNQGHVKLTGRGAGTQLTVDIMVQQPGVGDVLTQATSNATMTVVSSTTSTIVGTVTGTWNTTNTFTSNDTSETMDPATNTPTLVKLGSSVFRNFKISNISGEAGGASINIINDTVTVRLTDTRTENVVFSGIASYPKEHTAAVFNIQNGSGDIAIENSIWDRTKSKTFILLPATYAGQVDRLVLKNITARDATNFAQTGQVISLNAMTIKSLIIDSCNFEFPDNGSNSCYLVQFGSGAIEELSVVNVWFDADIGTMFRVRGGTGRPNIRITNSFLKCSHFMDVDREVSLSTVNSELGASTRLLQLESGADVYLASTGTVYDINALVNSSPGTVLVVPSMSTNPALGDTLTQAVSNATLLVKESTSTRITGVDLGTGTWDTTNTFTSDDAGAVMDPSPSTPSAVELRTLRINGTDVAYDKLLAGLSPVIGDFVRSSNASETVGAGDTGTYYYGNPSATPAWEKVTN